MTTSDLDALKAAFAAKGGTITVAPDAIAYGLDASVDKARRSEDQQRSDYGAIERNAERAFQMGVEANGYYKS